MSLQIQEHWRSCQKPPDRRPIWEWADGMEMPATLTHREFHVERSRHFMAPLDALQNDHVRQVVVRKPVRGGGTLIADLWHVWHRAHEPGPAMEILQTDEVAGYHAETRMMPMMLQCPEIASKLPDDRHKIRGESILFNDGIPFYISGPSINKLQTRGMRYISLDEVWLYKPGTVAEAEGRLKDYVRLENEKLLLISQGGIEGDDFDKKFMEGEQWEWNIRCASCGAQFPPHWSFEDPEGKRTGMRWDEIRVSSGMWDVDRCVETVRYECPRCSHPHFDSPRLKSDWNRTGEYVRISASNRTKKSYWWNAVISDPWRVLVSDYLHAVNMLRSGLPENIIAFFQKAMAEPKSEGTVFEGQINFKKVQHEANPQEDDFMIILSVDRQEEELYYATVRAWKRDGTSRRLWAGKLYTHGDLKRVADQYKCHNVFVDSGYQPKGDHGVYSICARYDSRNQPWIATKGAGEREFTHTLRNGKKFTRSYSPIGEGDPESGVPGQGRKLAKLIRFCEATMKDRLTALINHDRWTEPIAPPDDEFERDYRKQMSSEIKKQKIDKFTGKAEWKWVCPSRYNHFRDCAALQVLAATIAGVIPDKESEICQSEEK